MQRVSELSRAFRAPGLVLNVAVLGILLVFCFVVYKKQDDEKCLDNNFDDEDLRAAIAPIALWFFLQVALVVMRGLLRAGGYNSVSTTPDLNEGLAVLLMAMMWTVWNEFSITHMDNPLSSRAFSCKYCNDDQALQTIADTIASVTAGGAVMQIFRVLDSMANFTYGLDRWSLLPDTDSRLIVLTVSGLTTLWTCNLMLIWTDISNFESVFGLTFACCSAAAGMSSVTLWTMSRFMQYTNQDRVRYNRTRATRRESTQAFWKHLTACAVHVVSLVVAVIYKTQNRLEPQYDTNMQRAFRQYEVILDDLIFVDCVVIVCHGARVFVWSLAASDKLPSAIRNPWRFDAALRVVEYSLTAGILLLQFNTWCAWQDEDAVMRDWSARFDLMNPAWFWTIIVLNVGLQVVGSLHEFSTDIASMRIQDSKSRYDRSRVCNSYVIANSLAYFAVFLLFYLVFFNTDVTPGSSRIVPSDTCVESSNSCSFLLLKDAEALVHVRSAWRFFAVITMVLYLGFGAIDAVLDPHMRVLLFTTLGCVTKIGIGWGVLMLKTMAVPFSDGVGVTSYPSGLFLSLVPGLLATVAMISSNFFAG